MRRVVLSSVLILGTALLPTAVFAQDVYCTPQQGGAMLCRQLPQVSEEDAVAANQAAVDLQLVFGQAQVLQDNIDLAVARGDKAAEWRARIAKAAFDDAPFDRQVRLANEAVLKDDIARAVASGDKDAAIKARLAYLDYESTQPSDP